MLAGDVRMATVDAYRPDDEPAITAMFRRVFGDAATERNRIRWDWQYTRNPNCPAGGPEIWIARDGPTVIGQYATMPVRLVVQGLEVRASWGMDVMVAPERQRQGLGEILFRTWDEHVGASLGLGLSDSSYRLFLKLRWPDVGPVPCLVKPLTGRAVRRPNWPVPLNWAVSILAAPYVRFVSRARPLCAQVVPIQRFDDEFTALWERIGSKFAFIVRRDAPYLNWKFAAPPHVRYSIVALKRETELLGYAVYRHADEPRGRATLLIDFFVDPDDEAGMETLLRWVDREARAAGSDKIRVFSAHGGFRAIMKRSGYFQVKSTMEFTVKINAIDVPEAFYRDTSKWHVTFGDSDQDR
jgi:predicted N-acetyltransferase YhbS